MFGTPENLEKFLVLRVKCLTYIVGSVCENVDGFVLTDVDATTMEFLKSLTKLPADIAKRVASFDHVLTQGDYATKWSAILKQLHGSSDITKLFSELAKLCEAKCGLESRSGALSNLNKARNLKRDRVEANASGHDHGGGQPGSLANNHLWLCLGLGGLCQ